MFLHVQKSMRSYLKCFFTWHPLRVMHKYSKTRMCFCTSEYYNTFSVTYSVCNVIVMHLLSSLYILYNQTYAFLLKIIYKTYHFLFPYFDFKMNYDPRKCKGASKVFTVGAFDFIVPGRFARSKQNNELRLTFF